MALDHCNAARVDRAMATLAESDLQHAECKVAVLRSEQKVKSVKALVYAALSGSIEDRKQAVELDERVEAAWEAHFQRVKDFELIKAKREHEVRVIDLYRTLAASRRMGADV